MRKLMLTPDQASYSASMGDASLMARLSGGPSRTRRDFLGSVAQVSVGWTLPQDAFDYLQAFYRTASGEASQPFLIDLVIDGAALAEYVAKFIPGSYRLGAVRGLTTSVSATLEARPAPINEDLDNSIMDTYELYGDGGEDVYDALAHLVNVTLPASIGD